MNKLILGTVQFGLNYGINNIKGKPNENEVNKILNYAFKNKFEYLDTAESYGDSQDIIGNYIKSTKNNFKVITKFSKIRTDLPINIIARIEKNLDILGVKSLYCYMFHNFHDYKSFFNLFYNDLLILKKRGYIHKIGVSLHSNQEILEVLKNDIIDVIQLPFNLLDNASQREYFLRLAKNKGIEVHSRSVFLQGLFFKDINKINGKISVLRNDLSKVRKICKNEIINKFALNYACSKDYIDYVLIGVDSLRQLKENINSLKNIKKDTDFQEIDKIIVKDSSMLNPVNWK